MRHTHNLIITILLSITLCAPCFAQAEKQTLPSYQQQRQLFIEKQKAAGKKSPFSAQDKQVMKLSAERLAKILPDPGLKVGHQAPDFTLKNALGNKVSLYEQLNKGPVVLVFYRGAWCPFCNMHLHSLNKSLPAFKKYGAQLSSTRSRA